MGSFLLLPPWIQRRRRKIKNQSSKRNRWSEREKRDRSVKRNTTIEALFVGKNGSGGKADELVKWPL
jgi:hypothetical protein